MVWFQPLPATRTPCRTLRCRPCCRSTSGPRSPSSAGRGRICSTAAGRRYLDFGSGIAVTLLGHAHPHLVAVLEAQAEKLWHCSNLYGIEPQQRLAERLVAHSFADTAFFCNSGAEALECAIKMARRFHHGRGQGERHRIITFEGAFHGRTLATISAGGQEKHLEGFRPALPGFDAVTMGDLAGVEAAIGEQTAGILIEPIQGEGGIRTADPAFLEELRQLCDEHDVLLLFDEVQCGMGRTGRLFAYEWTRITPDIMTLAKGLGGGFPIGACLATARAASGMTTGSHGSTFGGNPLACAVANGVLDVLLERRLSRSRPGHGRAPARPAGRAGGDLSRRDPRGPGPGSPARAALRAAEHRDQRRAPGARPAHGSGRGQRGPPVAAADHRAGADRRGHRDAARTSCGASRDGRRRNERAAPAFSGPRRARCRHLARHPRSGGRAQVERPRRAARRQDAGDDLRQALDPDARVVRGRDQGAGRGRRRAQQQGHAARPRRDHRRYRPGAVPLRRCDHDPDRSPQRSFWRWPRRPRCR